MMLQARIYSWRRLPPPVERSIRTCLDSWLGTPYMEGQQCKGIAVDCVQFVGAFLDQMYRKPERTIIPRLRADSALHSVRSAFLTIKVLRQAYPTFVVRDDSIEPGDIVLVRSQGTDKSPRRPGHALIAGPGRPGLAYHADGHGGCVCRTSLAATSGILRVYRPKGKNLWVS